MIDSLAHISFDGNWIHNKSKIICTPENLSKELKKNYFKGAVVTGIYSILDYDHEKFINSLKPFKNLFPIAGFNPNLISSKIKIHNQLKKLKEMGYYGIKIHPRFDHFDPLSKRMFNTISSCVDLNFPIYFCTYFDQKEKFLLDYTAIEVVKKFLKYSSDIKLVLAHGGTVNLMEFSELCRFNDNLLLDLSLTIMKYENSSIDNDIRFLFKNLDEKICIGSDFPEYSHKKLNQRIKYFSKGINDHKIKNIAFRNISKFLNLGF